jgi:hypothetical protein
MLTVPITASTVIKYGQSPFLYTHVLSPAPWLFQKQGSDVVSFHLGGFQQVSLKDKDSETAWLSFVSFWCLKAICSNPLLSLNIHPVSVYISFIIKWRVLDRLLDW